MDQVRGCIPTLQQHLGKIDWECTVLSNSLYSDEQIEQYRNSLGAIRFVPNDRNAGYAGGVNRALKECRAAYILVLNPDCRLMDDNIGKLLEELDGDHGIAAIGPKVVFSNGEVQPSCRRFPRPWTFLLVRSVLRQLPGAVRERRRYLMEDFDHSEGRDVEWLSGGAIIARREAIDDVGPMDERFFLYMEDVDWCRRFKRGGWHVRYSPQSTVCHDAQHDSLGSITAMFKSPHTRFHLTSMLKYFLKYRFKTRD